MFLVVVHSDVLLFFSGMITCKLCLVCSFGCDILGALLAHPELCGLDNLDIGCENDDQRKDEAKHVVVEDISVVTIGHFQSFLVKEQSEFKKILL